MATDFEAIKRLGSPERVSELKTVISTLEREIAEREYSKAQAERSKEHRLDLSIDQLRREIASRKDDLKEARLLLVIAQEEVRAEELDKSVDSKREVREAAAAPAKKEYTVTQNLLQPVPEQQRSRQKGELENILAQERLAQKPVNDLNEISKGYEAQNKTYEARERVYESKDREDTYAKRAYEEKEKKEHEQATQKPKSLMSATEKIEEQYQQNKNYTS